MMEVGHRVSVVVLALTLLQLPALATAATLAPPERSYNFLVLNILGAPSHRDMFMPLVNELIKRGHKVTILSGFPTPPDLLTSITYIKHDLPYLNVMEIDLFAMRVSTASMFQNFARELPLVARDIYKVESVQQLYRRRHEFDLIMVDDNFNEPVYPFLYEKPFITVAITGLGPTHSAVLGNVLNPAYVPSLFADHQTPMSFVERVSNLFTTLAHGIRWRLYSVVPGVQREISRQFPDLPPLLEIERNQSLMLLNSHFSQDPPLPVLPAQVEVGGMHCRPGEPLPKDINDFVSGRESVIYFSLGSLTRESKVPPRYLQLLLSAFSKLPYKVLWKCQGGRDDLPKNVMVKEWLPQQDILAHPNVKLFISHCGMLSTQETMYHGVPVLALPIFWDQPRNALKIQRKGIGKMLIWEELTEQNIIESIEELMTNPTYQSEVSRISAIVKDQLQSPVERAVFWTEYVIRHSGAAHLRSPERDLSWVELLHLDILLALHVALFLVVWGMKKVVKLCCFGSPSSSRKTGKKKRD